VTDSLEIEQLLERVNNAWAHGPTEGMVETIGACFDEAMVIAGGPEVQVRGRGRVQCATSYASFLRICTLHECGFDPPAIEVTGPTAVAVCGWRMTFEHEGRIHRESGRDIFVFSKATGRWLAVWRAMLGR